jgi:hypothetical protein
VIEERCQRRRRWKGNLRRGGGQRREGLFRRPVKWRQMLKYRVKPRYKSCGSQLAMYGIVHFGPPLTETMRTGDRSEVHASKDRSCPQVFADAVQRRLRLPVFQPFSKHCSWHLPRLMFFFWQKALIRIWPTAHFQHPYAHPPNTLTLRTVTIMFAATFGNIQHSMGFIPALTHCTDRKIVHRQV